MLAKTSGSSLALLTYSQGSSSMLNKHGPASFVHSGGELGGLPHVTTAFFKAGVPLTKREVSSDPGGAYHPFHCDPLKEKETS